MPTKKPKEVVKEIKIIAKNDAVHMSAEGFTELEVLGLLRLYEQHQSLIVLKKFTE